MVEAEASQSSSALGAAQSFQNWKFIDAMVEAIAGAAHSFVRRVGVSGYQHPL
jgi:hypothetical protein